MGYECKILADSIGPNGARITTFQRTYPRYVLAEQNTHKMISKNSASSRAIPVKTQLKRIQDDPFVPFYWGKNQKGMQADEELPQEVIDQASFIWREQKNFAMNAAVALMELGVHKQITNRLLEPFMWHTDVVTATEYDNYEALRDHKSAAPEMQASAGPLRSLRAKNKPDILKEGEWHLPLVQNVDLQTLLNSGFSVMDCVKISTARCARTSYMTHDGIRDPKEDLKKHDELLASGHMSPFEHPAKALTKKEWLDLAYEQYKAWVYDRVPVGNFWGFHQYRKMLPNEHNFAKLQ